MDFDSRIWKHATGLASLGHKVFLVCPWQVEQGSKQSGVVFLPFRRVQSRLHRPWLIPARILWILLQRIRKADLFHFHDIDILPMMSAVSFLRPVVYDVHENYAEEVMVREWVWHWARRVLAFTVRWGQFVFSLLVKNIVLVAESQAEDFSHSRFRKIYLRNFASRSLLDRVRQDYPSRPAAVIFTGSQHVNNGSLLLLDIAEEMQKRFPHVPVMAPDRFTSALFRQTFMDEISRRRLSNMRLFPNTLPHELVDRLNEATVAISPNLRVPQQIKGIHTKLFEYMAAGLPVVASDLPHQKQVIEPNRAGLLAQPESPSSFVEAIARLLENRQFAEELGRNGQRAFREQYSWDSQMPKLEEFYFTILGKELKQHGAAQVAQHGS